MRISNQWVVNSFLRQLNRNHEGLNKTQIQVSSGKLIQQASENPVNNALSMAYKTEVLENEQYVKNISRVRANLDNTDGALTGLEATLQRARERGVQGANDTLVQQDRDAIAEEINQLLLHVIDIANTDIGGEFLFAGHDVKTKPFVAQDGQSGALMKDIVTYASGETRPGLNLLNPLDVAYFGDASRIMTEIEKGVTLEKNVSGAEVFFRSFPPSGQPGFTTAMPPLNPILPVDVLNSGRGMQEGVIVVTDGNGVDHQIDLSTARRLDDVLYFINEKASFEAGIEEVPSDTAVALGISRNAGPTNLLIGLADPKMLSESTPLTDLNTGLGVPGGFLSINTRDGRNTRIDISSATTVGDVLNLLNAAGAGTIVSAKYNMVHKRLEITDVTGGSGDFYIESKKTQLYIRDLPAHTAADLGLNTNVGGGNQIVAVFDRAIESESTPLELLNDGKGIERGFLDITGHDGVTTRVDLTQAQTVQDVLTAITTATAGRQTATWDPVAERMRIVDTSVDNGFDFRIEEVNDGAPIRVRDVTTVAKNLGLLKSSQGNTLIGDALSPVGLTEASALTSLVPAPERGFLVLRGADDEPVQVDLHGAATIGDVLTAINDTGKFDAAWDTTANRFVVADITGVGGNYGIRGEEFTNTARDLGFVQGTMNYTSDVITGGPLQIESLPTLVGSLDLNPAVEETTELSALNSNRILGKGVNLGFIRITDKAGRFKAIDMRGAKTVKDVLDRINDTANGLYVEARINSARNGIEIIDQNHGATGKLQIIDIDSTTAYDLGISGTTVDHNLIGRDIDPAVTDATSIASLRVNEGGVPLGKISVQSGEFSGEIDLAGVTTVGEMIEKLSMSDTRFNMSAWISEDGKKLQISQTKGQPYLKVRDLGDPPQGTAAALGLGGTRSIFSTLQDLRDNLLRNDAKAISEESIRDLSDDLERVLKFHAEVGVKTNRATAAEEKQENFTLNLRKMLDVVENVDMTEAITNMTQLETAFRAALQTGARVMQTTLMDFLG